MQLEIRMAIALGEGLEMKQATRVPRVAGDTGVGTLWEYLQLFISVNFQ